jgi:hypothetical protein
MTKFNLNSKYIKSVTVVKPSKIYYEGKWHSGTSTYTEDHKIFAEFRNELEEKKFITIERRWWNGDRVIKPFDFNGLKFEKKDIFPCADALNIKLLLLQQKSMKQQIGVTEKSRRKTRSE